MKPADIHWIRGGIEEAGRAREDHGEAAAGRAPRQRARRARRFPACSTRGEIDGFIAPRPPSFIERGHPNVGWLFRDPIAAAKDWYQRTGIFPIMHLIGIRRTLVDKHPWLPVAVFKAFEQSKTAALAALSDTSATKVTLPFVEETLKSVRELMGDDFWSYGVEPQPQDAGGVPAPPPFAGAVAAADEGGGAVPSLGVRDVQAVVIIHRAGPRPPPLPGLSGSRRTPATRAFSRLPESEGDSHRGRLVISWVGLIWLEGTQWAGPILRTCVNA